MADSEVSRLLARFRWFRFQIIRTLAKVIVVQLLLKRFVRRFREHRFFFKNRQDTHRLDSSREKRYFDLSLVFFFSLRVTFQYGVIKKKKKKSWKINSRYSRLSRNVEIVRSIKLFFVDTFSFVSKEELLKRMELHRINFRV